MRTTNSFRRSSVFDPKPCLTPLNLLDRLKDPKCGDLTESTFHVESTEEAAARRHEASEQAKHKRMERLTILWFALVMVFGFSAWCIYVCLTGSVDDKKWAQTIVEIGRAHV